MTEITYYDTIAVVRNVLNEDQCKSIVDEFENTPETCVYHENSLNYSTNTVAPSPFDIILLHPESKNFPLVHSTTEKLIHNWIDHLQSLDCFLTTTLKSELRYAHRYRILRYKKGDYIHPHIDWENFIHASVTINLNDEYTGGEFQFFNGKKSIQLGTGDAIVFPASHYWVHQVTPILTGTRYSINSFICSLPYDLLTTFSKLSRMIESNFGNNPYKFTTITNGEQL